MRAAAAQRGVWTPRAAGRRCGRPWDARVRGVRGRRRPRLAAGQPRSQQRRAISSRPLPRPRCAARESWPQAGRTTARSGCGFGRRIRRSRTRTPRPRRSAREGRRAEEKRHPLRSEAAAAGRSAQRNGRCKSGEVARRRARGGARVPDTRAAPSLAAVPRSLPRCASLHAAAAPARAAARREEVRHSAARGAPRRAACRRAVAATRTFARSCLRCTLFLLMLLRRRHPRARQRPRACCSRTLNRPCERALRASRVKGSQHQTAAARAARDARRFSAPPADAATRARFRDSSSVPPLSEPFCLLLVHAGLTATHSLVIVRRTTAQRSSACVGCGDVAQCSVPTEAPSRRAADAAAQLLRRPPALPLRLRLGMVSLCCCDAAGPSTCGVQGSTSMARGEAPPAALHCGPSFARRTRPRRAQRSVASDSTSRAC